MFVDLEYVSTLEVGDDNFGVGIILHDRASGRASE